MADQTTLFSLPSELLLVIFDHLDGKSLKLIRLVCRITADLAAAALFRSLHLWPQHVSIQRLHFILQHKDFSKHVKSLEISASDGWDTSSPESELISDPRHPRHARSKTRQSKKAAKASRWLEAISDLGHLPYLDTVVVDIDERFTGPARELVLFRFLEALRSRPLRSLKINGLQNYTFARLSLCTGLKSILCNIRDLHIRIDPSVGWDRPHQQRSISEEEGYYHELCSIWLVPASQTLTSLSLHHERTWGVFSTCLNAGYFTFPALRSLTLGSYAIGYDDQIEWILKLKNLRKLYLVDCAIVCRFLVSLHSEHAIPKRDWIYRGLDSVDGWHHYVFKTTWADVFDRFRTDLQLETFSFTTNPLPPYFSAFRTNVDYVTLSTWLYIMFRVAGRGHYPLLVPDPGSFAWQEKPLGDGDEAIYDHIVREERDNEALSRLVEGCSVQI